MAAMLSWTPEECMMSKRRCSGHSSPTGERTNGGASTTNTITPLICGLSTQTPSLPLKPHMQKHHPTPNQKHPAPPSTYNPPLPFSSKSLTSRAITPPATIPAIQTSSDVLEEYSSAAGLFTEATRTRIHVL